MACRSARRTRVRRGAWSARPVPPRREANAALSHQAKAAVAPTWNARCERLVTSRVNVGTAMVERSHRSRIERAKSRPGSGLRSGCGGRPCGPTSPAVLGLAGLPHNSLRSLRSLRSDRCGKSEVAAPLARAAARPCAPRRRKVAAPAARPRLCRAAPSLRGCSASRSRCCTPSRGRVAGGAPLRRRGAQGFDDPRAQRASHL